MDLVEYEGKQLFKKHGIPVPEGVVYTGEPVTLPAGDRLVIKAQIPAGKRKAAGGIKIVDRDSALDTADRMLGSEIAGKPVTAVLIESFIDIRDEVYVSLSPNRAGKNYHLVFSEQGGSGIESVADADPDAIHMADFYDFEKDAVSGSLDLHHHAEQVLHIVHQMHTLLRAEDAVLVEVNPLVITADGDIVAADAKVRIDDNAIYRHEQYPADEGGLEFVPLDGNIAVIGNGAGLVMATLDSLHHFGGAPADFLDIGGGADMNTMQDAMQTVMQQEQVDGLFINIFGGITRCDEVANGIIDVVEAEQLDLPLVVRMVGTNQAEGRKLLEDHGIHALDSMDACAETIVELVGREGQNHAD